MTTGHKICQHSAFRRLAAALTLAIVLCLISAPPASAQNLGDFFQISYDPVTFDKSEVTGDEVFHAILTGRATCSMDFPISASEATITSQVVAQHIDSGAMVTLNPNYTVVIKPFPSKKGETAEISQAVPLQFPPEAESGDYNVIGQLVEAKVKVIFWVPVTAFLPQEQQMGTVKYTAPESTPALPENPPASETEPSHTATEPAIPWWVAIIVLIAVAVTVFNAIWFRRRHR